MPEDGANFDRVISIIERYADEHENDPWPSQILDTAQTFKEDGIDIADRGQRRAVMWGMGSGISYAGGVTPESQMSIVSLCGWIEILGRELERT